MSSQREASGGALDLAAQDCELVIFDLDGVLTRTARVHAAAWKQLFDAFLCRRLGAGFRPFDAADYHAHVDGRPRLDGVRAFLASRGLALPDGTPDDGPDDDTVHGLGNAKNRAFTEALERDGVEICAGAAALLRALADCGIRRAVVSASRNCRRVLERAGLAASVDLVLDGNDAARDGLAGKPAPDTFLAAAGRLAVPPSRAVVFEDAESGVAAARAGGFARVVGVGQGEHAAALREHGADGVVDSLERVRSRPLPSALDVVDDLRRRAAVRAPALFLDYDGTLTPIVARPQDAVLDPAVRDTLARLARRGPVVVVTGRGLDVIRELVAVDGVIFAADHGFQVLMPGRGVEVERPRAAIGFEERVRDATAQLARRLDAVSGALVEPKRFSVAVHYRLVAEHDVARVRRSVDEVLAAQPRLRLLTGKKVLELQPDLDWDKGAAVAFVIERLGLDPASAIVVGDDVTDEAAFRRFGDVATTVVVQPAPAPTAARLRLRDPGEVHALLRRIEHSRAPAPAP